MGREVAHACRYFPEMYRHRSEHEKRVRGGGGAQNKRRATPQTPPFPSPTQHACMHPPIPWSDRVLAAGAHGCGLQKGVHGMFRASRCFPVLFVEHVEQTVVSLEGALLFTRQLAATSTLQAKERVSIERGTSSSSCGPAGGTGISRFLARKTGIHCVPNLTRQM